MSREKQIEEMARKIECARGDVENWHCRDTNCLDCTYKRCKNSYVAESLYNAGYRKQSENVIELPCKVGDRIYRLNRLCSAINEATVKAIYFTENEKYYPKSHLIIQYDLARGRVRVNFSEFGKTVFFSREEAEAKMKGGAE